MSWAKVDDQWWAHPKTLGVSLAARGMWISVLSWSCAQRRDVVPVGFVRMLDPTTGEDLATELVEAGLWVAVDDGWRIHDWDEYQELTTSEKRAEAGRKGGIRSGITRSNEATSKQNEAKTPADTEASEATPESNGEANSKQNGVASRSKRQANAEAGSPARPGPARPKSARAVIDETEIDLDRALKGLAMERAVLKHAHNPEGLAQKILAEDYDDLLRELDERRSHRAEQAAITECDRCDTNGSLWSTRSGDIVTFDHPDAVTCSPCSHTLTGAAT